MDENRGLSDAQLGFLDSVSHHNDRAESDDNPPRFPVLSTCIITAVFLALLAIAIYAVSYSSRYVSVFNDSTVKSILASNSITTSSLSTVSLVYNERALIYSLLAIFYAAIEGSVCLMHWYHITRWRSHHEN